MKIRDEDLRRELQIALEGRDSHSKCAFRLGMRNDNFKELLSRARVHGIDAVLHCNTPRGYTDEFKLKVVHSAVLEGMPKSRVATNVGAHQKGNVKAHQKSKQIVLLLGTKE